MQIRLLNGRLWELNGKKTGVHRYTVCIMLLEVFFAAGRGSGRRAMGLGDLPVTFEVDK